MNLLAQIGAQRIQKWQRFNYTLATAVTVLATAVRPRTWRGPLRNVLARQILFTGVDAIRFLATIAFMVGVSVVVQAQLWLGKVGHSGMLGPLLIAVIFRELAPLLTNFIIIGRSGTAVATELGNMKINGEVRLLDAQGMDPFLYLVVPRAIGMAVSCFCLTVIFIAVTLIGGYLVGRTIGVTDVDALLYADSVLGALKRADIWNLLAKTIVPGTLTGCICAIEGLSVGSSVTEVPQATTRAVVRSITYLFAFSTLVSALSYL